MGLSPNGRSEPLYRSVIGLALATCKVMRWDVRVSGAEHVPATGAAVIASNHVGFLDFVFLGFAARPQRRLVRFMAIQQAFDHWLGGPLLRGMRHIPVDREGAAGDALDRAVRALEAGEVVGIHPQGRISESIDREAAKTGAARMALATGAPLIPAAVLGTERILARGVRPRFPRNVPITVRLGPPIPFDATTGQRELTAELMDRIEELWGAAGRSTGCRWRPSALPASASGAAPRPSRGRRRPAGAGTGSVGR